MGFGFDWTSGVLSASRVASGWVAEAHGHRSLVEGFAALHLGPRLLRVRGGGPVERSMGRLVG